MSYDNIRAATGAPVSVYEHEVRVPPERIDRKLRDGQELTCGSARLRVIHTPGHTPGSICLLMGKLLITGDTLFDGGPGKTFARGDLETVLRSISARLLPLPDETAVLPGHGANTTIAESRLGYAEYERHPKPAGFHGDVTWR